MSSKRNPVLDHLVAMTDDVGLIQHATHDVPNRSTGYCTDDIARALIVAIGAAQSERTEALANGLITIYLSYLHDAQMSDGWFHNFMGYDRTWQDVRGTPDSLGRAIWGLGVCMRTAPRDSWRRVASNLVHNALPHVEQLDHRRSRAYAALGLVEALAAEPTDGEIRAALVHAVESLYRDFERHERPDWRWCEEQMSYDNGRLCEALIRGGAALSQPHFVRTGLDMLDFYASIVIEDGTFVPIGNDGWYRRGGPRARFGQQPLEAAAMVEAGLAAYAQTGDERYRRYTQTAYDWFFGRNTHGALLVTNGGCRDGIDRSGVNPNMGAESTLAYLASAFALAREPVQTLRAAR